MSGLQFVILLAVCSFATLTKASGHHKDQQQCINALVDWCSGNNYENAFYSYWTVTEKVDGYDYYLQCLTYTNGTVCYRNGELWFECLPQAHGDNVAVYKGETLCKDSPNGGDCEICYAASRITTITWTIKDDLQCCVNDLVSWCNAQDYSNICPSVWTVYDVYTGQHYYAECKTDTSGTVCYLNGSFLFQCSCDHTVTYKDAVLSLNSIYGADCQICYISSYIASINLNPVSPCC